MNVKLNPPDQRITGQQFFPPLPPMWVCPCGARNRLRDLQCRACGGLKP